MDFTQAFTSCMNAEVRPLDTGVFCIILQLILEA